MGGRLAAGCLLSAGLCHELGAISHIALALAATTSLPHAQLYESSKDVLKHIQDTFRTT